EPISDSLGARRSHLCSNRYFTTEKVEFQPGASYQGKCDGSTLEIWGVIEGTAVVAGTSIDALDFVLLPATLGHFTVKSAASSTLLRIHTGPKQ
ncbi:MAG: hypothetical protein R3293_05210, partial [Candidatus Promineifilaceae bacterium]|nr:hypothetical protein [Candidatus Promineifilaceae bacterium]